MPSSDVPKPSWISFKHIDKIVHLGMYFFLTFILIFDTIRAGTVYTRSKVLLFSALFALLYGVFIEIFQGVFTASRSADGFDAVFNTLGITLAVTLIILIKIFK